MKRPGTEAARALKQQRLRAITGQILVLNQRLSRHDLSDENRRTMQHNKKNLQRTASRLRREIA